MPCMGAICAIRGNGSNRYVPLGWLTGTPWRPGLLRKLMPRSGTPYGDGQTTHDEETRWFTEKVKPRKPMLRA
jgi:hypothetical protein